MITRPAYHREGQAHVFDWPDVALRAEVDRLSEARGSVHGEIRFTCQGRVAHHARCDLLSSRSRSDYARVLDDRLATVVEVGDAGVALEYVVQDVLGALREGVPVIDLSLGTVDFERPTHLLEPAVLPLNETATVYAPPSGGKSYFGLIAGFAVASAMPLPAPLEVTDYGPVLVADWETNDDVYRRRSELIARGAGMRRPQLHYARLTRPLADHVDQLQRFVDREGVRLAIVDSAAGAAGNTLREEQIATATMTALRALNCTRLLLAHVNKTEAVNVNAPASIFGSQYWTAYSRSAWELRGAASDDHPERRLYALYHRKANDEALRRLPVVYRLAFDRDEHAVRIEAARLEDAPELMAGAPLALQVEAHLRHGAASTAELSEALGADGAAIRVTLHRLRQSGKAVQLEAGAKNRPAVWGLRARESA